VLTYHHVGPRPRGARLKGLYVSPRLWERQLSELKSAGFVTPPFSGVLSTGPASVVFITFDDGFKDVFDHALGGLRAHGFTGVLFLVSSLLGKTNEWQQRAGDISEPLMDESQVRDWLAAGQEIGSHTRTHPHLTRISKAAARQEIEDSRKELEDRFGRPIRHFCYPYGDWNQEVRDLAGAAGYETACTTERGINRPGDDPLALKRYTARYPSRNWRSFWAWLKPA
jgi:peptidoglycan/xylan/chitin deacetylase (PgdA/CDA1 family)